MRPSGYLQTVDRALIVLGAFTHSHSSWGVSELARELGLEKSHTQRILATLAYRGFLATDPRSRKYRLGPALVGLGRLAERSDRVTALIRPVLGQLARSTGHSAVFNVPELDEYRCAAAADGTAPVRYAAIVGQVFPGNGGAGGHAIFASYPEREVRALFDQGLRRYTETTLVELDDLLARYDAVRTRGAAVSRGEYDDRVMAVAAPARAHGTVIGSVAVLGPHDSVAVHEEAVVDRVVEAAANVSELLETPSISDRDEPAEK